jgi:NDP-sugar pyrophosphorylase family protein
VVLAAGEGTRLRPLTELVPKALCPVGNVPLLGLALRHLAALGFTGPGVIAVNACYLADQIVDFTAGKATVSVEPGPRPLGTAAGLGQLLDWIDGRGVLVGNADAYLSGAGIGPLLDGWDGTSTRLLGVPTHDQDPYRFGRHRFAGWSLLPWSRVSTLPARPSEPVELVKTIWRPAEAAGELTVVGYPATFVDTGTPLDYLVANLHAAGEPGLLVDPGAEVTGTAENSVIGAGAVVAGDVTRTVVWPGARVERGERLRDAIRYGRSGTVTV